MAIALHALGLAAVIFLIAEFFPRIRCESYGTALLVAVVYSIANFLLFWILALLTLPLMLLSLGLFTFVINAVLLWLTDQLIDDFEIDGVGTTVGAAIVITLANVLLEMILG